MAIAAAQNDDLLKYAKDFARRHKCPPPVCFRQTRNCCWMFKHCGDVNRPGTGRKRCNKKICVVNPKAKLCKVECKKEPKKEKRRVCKRNLKKVGKICGKIWYTDKGGKKVCKDVCKDKYETRNDCVMKEFTKMEQKCRKKCNTGKKTKCKTFKNWWCYGKGDVKYPKYCANLKCDQKVSQPDKPKDIVIYNEQLLEEIKKQKVEIEKIKKKMAEELAGE